MRTAREPMRTAAERKDYSKEWSVDVIRNLIGRRNQTATGRPFFFAGMNRGNLRTTAAAA